MLEYVVVGILVAAALALVIRRLVKGVSGGGCSSCSRCAPGEEPSCDDDQPPRSDETPGG